MTATDQIDIIHLPREASAEGAPVWPQGWPEDVILALRRDASGLSLMPCHIEETSDALIARLAHIEGQPRAAYRIYPPVTSEQYRDQIARLLQERDELFERAEEFALNYEFMVPPAEKRADPADTPAPDAPEEAQPVENAVELAGLALKIAADGAAHLHFPGGQGAWSPDWTVITQSADGSRLQLDLAAMLAEGGNPADVHFPAGSFVFRNADYAVSRRGTKLYFLPKFVTTAPVARQGSPRQLAILATMGVVLLVGGILIGRSFAGAAATPPPAPVEALRDSLF